ncbi:MAG: Ppx/GppA family phosphatase [Actinomycetales bacterium]|nr:Ppx/GppA family phosphatase [Actinomycetales bacterium]
MTRVAAIDCGTHSLRLLVADVDPATGVLGDVRRHMEVVRLGKGVDRTGRISSAALRRAMAVLRTYGRWCQEAGVEQLRIVATSASRDAANRADFVAGVRDILDAEPEVVSGEEEAALSFLGATAGLAGGYTPPFLVVDLGGGSTELVLGSRTVEAARSVDLGCLRMTERHLHGDPPTPAQVETAVADIDAAIDLAARTVPLASTGTLIGLAGSVTTVTAHALGLPGYDPGRIHGAELPVPTVRKACTELLSMSRRERSALPYMHPGRVDVIGGGALVWRCLVDRVSAEAGIVTVVTSEHDILDGIAWSLACQ